jgi:hypothetical protein
MRLKNALNALGDHCRFFAASRNFCAARFAACARRGRFHRAPRFLRVVGQAQPTAQVLLTRLERLAILQADMAYAYQAGINSSSTSLQDLPSAKYRLLRLSRERSTSRWIALHFFWPQGPAW